jgi:transcriptional regulator with XRE-family HTH domain
MQLDKTIGKNLKTYRESLGYTQDHVANFLEIDRSLISHYENSDREISIVHLQRISDLFGIEIEDLMEEDAVKMNANMAFAFRGEGALAKDDIFSIAAFQKMVKNYINMKRLADEQK